MIILKLNYTNRVLKKSDLSVRASSGAGNQRSLSVFCCQKYRSGDDLISLEVAKSPTSQTETFQPNFYFGAKAAQMMEDGKYKIQNTMLF